MLAALLAMVLGSAAQPGAPQGAPPGPGVSEALARERAATIRDLRYELSLTIPPDRRQPVTGAVIIRLTLPGPQRIVLDFQQPRDRVRAVTAGGRPVDAVIADGHIIVPASATAAGANELAVEFIAGDEALNRNDEFLYSLFVPARAQLAFPCFVQPDLKGRYSLSLRVPDGWQAVANGAGGPGAGGPGSGGQGAGGQGDLVRFAETQQLPTYLFSFVAGKISV